MDNDTPLQYACEHGHKEAAQYLIQEGKCDVGMFIIVHNYAKPDLTTHRCKEQYKCDSPSRSLHE